MTRHDSVSTFARSVVGGAVLFGSLFAPETPEDRRRREARALMFGTTPDQWRGWPGLSSANYGTERGEPVPPEDGDCPEWLAVLLGVAGLAFLFTLVVYGFWSMSK